MHQVLEQASTTMDNKTEKPLEVTLPDEDISLPSSDEGDSSSMRSRLRKHSRSIGIGTLCLVVLVVTLSAVLSNSSKNGDSSNNSLSNQKIAPSSSPTSNLSGSHPTSPQVPDSSTTSKPSEKQPSFPLYINCGGTKPYQDSSDPNIVWIPDDSFLVGDSQGTSFSANCQLPIIDATVDDEILCTGRSFPDTASLARFEIPALEKSASYLIILYFFGWDDNWSRKFDVTIEGYTIFSNLNVLLEAGGQNTMYRLDSVVPVTDGTISIDLAKVTGNLIIAGIEIHKTDLASITEPIVQKSTRVVTYIPGNLTVSENGLILSEGLTAKIISKTGLPVNYSNGQQSAIPFHVNPDAGACFVDPRPWNVGGWIYTSNSEAKKVENGDQFPGGVGALTFDKEGRLIDYRMILENTRMNCGGGPTPWGAWISGEEYGNLPNATNTGKVWQTDPTGERPAQRITLGETYPGMFESFAYDIRDKSQPRFFMTRDHDKVGDVRRWTPDSVDWDDPWNILLGNGTLEYLVVQPNPGSNDIGSYFWTTDWNMAIESCKDYFPNPEGIDVVGDTLYFVPKKAKSMFVLNLDDNKYYNISTKGGLFDGQPDQLIRLFDYANNKTDDESILYMTEDGGKYAGVHGRNSNGDYVTILESHEYADETTGLAFSPDAKHMYVAYQDNGLLFDVTRKDGLPFNGMTLAVKFHQVDQL